MTHKSKESNDSLYKILDLARDGNLPEIQRLVERDSSLIHQQDENGMTLLMAASSSGNLELVKFLVEAGSDVNLLDVDGDFPLLNAARKRAWEVFDY